MYTCISFVINVIQYNVYLIDVFYYGFIMLCIYIDLNEESMTLFYVECVLLDTTSANPVEPPTVCNTISFIQSQKEAFLTDNVRINAVFIMKYQNMKIIYQIVLCRRQAEAIVVPIIFMMSSVTSALNYYGFLTSTIHQSGQKETAINRLDQLLDQ